ncbi:MAG TPA: copper chaperone PCu(A)C [Steroidobacteraceae bacterium]|nr:copper chaperone PCu(A)C [Steroidobacteraceae bacterium]
MRKSPGRGHLFAGLASLLTAAAVLAAGQPAVSDAWARATPPGATVGAVYMTILGGDGGDRLLGAATDRAGAVELHTVVDDGGMARMRPIEYLDLPAGERTQLAPQGTHLMLIDLQSPLVAGDEFTLTLRFAAAGEHEVTVVVRPATAGDEHGEHRHH